MPGQILFVEDDEVVATLVVELLGRLGDVRWTSSAEEAAAVVGRRDWALIISDIELPGVNGLEFIRTVNAAQPAVAKLVLSSHSSFDHAVAALPAGAHGRARAATAPCPRSARPR